MYRFLCYLCLITLHTCSSHSIGESIFAGKVYKPSYDPLDFINVVDMPQSCEGKNFCFDKGDDYPEDKIEKVLENFAEYQPVNARTPRSLSFREGDDVKGNPDCPSNDTFIDQPIYYIRDEKKNVRVVIQSLTKFRQIYSVKWCQNPGRITEDTPNFLKGSLTLRKYKIECVNTYMDFDFIVLSDDDLKMEAARPMGGIPVCCRCRYSIGAD